MASGVESFRPISNGNPGGSPIVTAPGLQAIYSACRRIYPDQPNPLQVTAVVKFWSVTSLIVCMFVNNTKILVFVLTVIKLHLFSISDFFH